MPPTPRKKTIRWRMLRRRSDGYWFSGIRDGRGGRTTYEFSASPSDALAYASLTAAADMWKKLTLKYRAEHFDIVHETHPRDIPAPSPTP